MKNVLALTLVLSSLYVSSANALVTGSLTPCSKEYNDSERAITCTLFITTSLPSLLVGADLKEMNQAEASAFIKAEAQNYLDGVDGDYLLLKMTAKSMNESVDVVAKDLLK
jgi:hypothetical protein